MNKSVLDIFVGRYLKVTKSELKKMASIINAIRNPGAYIRLNENGTSNNKMKYVKIIGAMTLLVFVLFMLSKFTNTNNDGDLSDPDTFEKLLETGSQQIQQEEDKKVNVQEEIDGEDTELPKGCISRRNDHPGTNSGARIQYIHIPKTGGTSIEKAMWGWNHGVVFRNNHVNIDGSNEKCAPASPNYFLLAGHRGYGFCKDIKESKRGLFTFTALRDPVSRAISLYDMEKALKGKFFTRVFGTRPLKEWLREFNKTEKIEEGEAFLRFMGSQQARFLCGYECFLPKNKSMNHESYLLAKAKQNLPLVDAVGITERLNDIIPQLKLHLRWLPVGFRSWPHNNERRGHSDVDDQARAILASYSQTDMELYKMAEKIAKEKTNKAKDCLAAMKDVRRL
jgi:hypothetical protein